MMRLMTISGTFSFEVRKAMPLGIVPQAASPVKDQYAFDVQLIPEKPDNW